MPEGAKEAGRVTHVIRSYPLGPGETELSIPVGSRVLSVEFSYGIPTLYVMASLGAAEMKLRHFRVITTGNMFDYDEQEYYLEDIGSCVNPLNGLAYHVFEKCYHEDMPF